MPNSVLRHHVTYDANGKIETVDYDAIKEYVTQHVKDPSKTTALENLGLMRALKTSDGTDAIVASLNAS
ncbi:hypothetical protein GW750_01410 [bacterium]|nr:hypothetical protein [bacterium]